MPVLSIQGDSTRRMYGVQISSDYFAHALTDLNAFMTMIRADKTAKLVMSSYDVTGMEEYCTITRRSYVF